MTLVPTTKMNSVTVKYTITFQRPRTVRTLVNEVLCLFRKASRFFYENIHRYATNAVEKETLRKQGENSSRPRVDMESVNYVDISAEFPSIQLFSKQEFNCLRLCVGIVQRMKPHRGNLSGRALRKLNMEDWLGTFH
eukprot:Gregarina_sp_Poly_1__1051@NODE_1259_length_4600_cov_7_860578_g855_i0_p4_GENE_NODE_1259_length_4600_cov_7_860578_g855_i0NODE_1259_length_4600_cov_7_860578_g855_i0_p4_ORF_typecomplete_len137_score6_67FAD_binding_1/PF00667_20/1_8e07tRNA_bind_2/PF13725_6/0_13_NODE_1259_length_4600_cov_7_860578_g855_i0455865